MVVDKGNGLVRLFDAIDGDAHSIVTRLRLRDGNVVDRLPVTVVHLEPIPIGGDARRKMQFVDFEPEPQE